MSVSNTIIHHSLRFSLNISKFKAKIGHKLKFLIDVPNLKDINLQKGVFGWLKVTFGKQCKEENVKKWSNFQKHIL